MNKLIDIIADIIAGVIAIFILCCFGMSIVVLISFIYDIIRWL